MHDITAIKPKAGIPAVSASDIVARLDRLPITFWHLKVRSILGMATFFDGFDAIAIAFVIPALIHDWALKPAEIGILLSSGFVGQLIGAPLFGIMAERYGRIRVLNWTIAILSVFGLACAFAWNLWSLALLRFLQGCGIGGEIPVAATYVSEIAKSSARGRFLSLYQLMLPIGFLSASVSSIFVVPYLGWQWMFVAGAVPAVLTVMLRRLVPESPRWLARNGRIAEADRVLQDIELVVARQSGRPLPAPQPVDTGSSAPGRFAHLFDPRYLRRTALVWTMWFCSAMILYGLMTWLPTIFRTRYSMTTGHALLYSVAGNFVLLISGLICAMVLDKIPRKTFFVGSFALASLPLAMLYFVARDASALTMMSLAALSSMMISFVNLGVWTYTPELYPTGVRSIGVGTASAWARVASIAAPNIVGVFMTYADFGSVFLMFAVVGLVGAAAVMILGVETRGRLLETVSPEI
jgi:MFS transporter, putative metabolite:H+ symporter